MTDGGGRRRAEENREKRNVALSSVAASVFLTAMKLVVGLATGSLGLLSEAAHSGLDLVAAVLTFMAVRVSGRPADPEHTYGHGKFENLSALFETLLLLATCGWIIYEAVRRLFFHAVHVEASIWGFLIMGLAILIDFTRSRVLARAARKYDSQALEADGLHFATDIWSSAVVIAGLFLVWLSDRLRIPWLAHADAVAALGVACIVVYVSLRLGRQTIEGLVDAVPPGLQEDVRRAVKVPGVLDVGRVRVRRSGPAAFADVTLGVKRQTTLEEADGIATAAEEAVREILPGADVVVHVDPLRAPGEEAAATVRLLAARQGLSAHSIRVTALGGRRTLEVHLEISDRLRLEDAHAQAAALEDALRAALPGIDRVVTHLEPADEETSGAAPAPGDERRVFEALEVLPAETAIDCHPENVQVVRVDGHLDLSFDCHVDADASLVEAHEAVEQVEVTLRRLVPELGHVIIHVEPADDETPS